MLAGIGMDRVADAEFIAMARAAMPALLSAVRNVLALHQPYPIKHMLICEDCSESWPCSTVKALTDALEGGE